MRWPPKGYGGQRSDPEQVKRRGWREQCVLAVEKTYGPQPPSIVTVEAINAS